MLHVIIGKCSYILLVDGHDEGTIYTINQSQQIMEQTKVIEGVVLSYASKLYHSVINKSKKY